MGKMKVAPGLMARLRCTTFANDHEFLQPEQKRPDLELARSPARVRSSITKMGVACGTEQVCLKRPAWSSSFQALPCRVLLVCPLLCRLFPPGWNTNVSISSPPSCVAPFLPRGRARCVSVILAKGEPLCTSTRAGRRKMIF